MAVIASVARQWNDRLGKVDNCQVGVYAALSRGRLSTLIDTRLYLPSSWIEDKAHCVAAQVPHKARRSKSKPELALEMVRRNRGLGVRFCWVGADGLYGNDPAFLRALEDNGAFALLRKTNRTQHVHPLCRQNLAPAHADTRLSSAWPNPWQSWNSPNTAYLLPIRKQEKVPRPSERNPIIVVSRMNC